MCDALCLVIITILIALAFDVVNGFHDSANSIATIVSTRVLKPGQAVLWAAFFNFVAMFFLPPKVAETIAQIVKIEAHDSIFIYVVLIGLIAAIIWDLLTWYLGLPTSSSHALIGGFAGAGVAYKGWMILQWNKLIEIMIFIVLAPVMGFILGMAIMFSIYWIFRKWRPSRVDRTFRIGQLFSAALYSIGHGSNDAQKTMGLIVAVLFAGGVFDSTIQLSLTDLRTLWIILLCHLAMGIGTALGGWRIVKTMGMRIVKLKPESGFCAESAGAFTLFFATQAGIPVSTTHTIIGSIIGAGSLGVSASRVKWGVAARIIWAWVLTIPASGLLAAGLFYFTMKFVL